MQQGYATKILLGINLSVFAWMAWQWKGVFPQDDILFIQMGGVNRMLVMQDGEYWRLLSAMFMHGGLIHLAMNMYALWIAGHFLENMLGFKWFSIFYILCGLGGSIGSIWWNDLLTVSVGASGAIFGIIGMLTGMLLLGRIYQPESRNRLLKNMLIIIGLNVALGLSIPGIDNAGHMGGLFTGLFIGLCLGLGLRPGVSKSHRRILALVAASFTVALLAGFLWVIPMH
jgi:rhomboid protease GluP